MQEKEKPVWTYAFVTGSGLVSIWNEKRMLVCEGMPEDLAKQICESVNSLSHLESLQSEDEAYVSALVERNNELGALVSWLDSECPAGTMTHDLSHDFADNLRLQINTLLNPSTDNGK